MSYISYMLQIVNNRHRYTIISLFVMCKNILIIPFVVLNISWYTYTCLFLENPVLKFFIRNKFIFTECDLNFLWYDLSIHWCTSSSQVNRTLFPPIWATICFICCSHKFCRWGLKIAQSIDFLQLWHNYYYLL